MTGGKLEFYNGDGTTRRTVLRHVRMGKGVVQADLTFLTGIDAGIIVNYQDPENFGVVLLDDNGSGTVTPRYVEFADGQKQAVRTGLTTSFGLTNNTAYTLKCVIDDDPGNSALQRLTLYVNGTQRMQTTTVDDTWSGGHVGLYRATNLNATTTLQWDNFKCGKDNNADGDADDTGTDYVYASYDFAGTTLTFSHDHAGNLTNDGLFQYRYDAWNRLTEVYYAAGDASVSGQRVAKYEYDGLFRRTRKVVNNQGGGVVAGSDEGLTITGIQAGDREERYYYAGWRLVETRNGSDLTLNQFCYGTQYIDEPIAYDRDTDSDGDCLDAGSRRYFYHQDANYRVVALTSESGTVIERYDYSAYGEPTVLKGGSTEAGNTLYVSSVGNPFLHQGLFRDGESLSYQNRFRQLLARHGRFAQRDILGYINGANLYNYLKNNFIYADPLGLQIVVSGNKDVRKRVEDALKNICSRARVNEKTGVVSLDPESPNTTNTGKNSDDCPQDEDNGSPPPPKNPKGCEMLKRLIDAPRSSPFKIVETDSSKRNSDGVYYKTRTISIRKNPTNKIIIVGQETRPATYWETLAHELVHADRHLAKPTLFDDIKTDRQRKNEERNVIIITNSLIDEYNLNHPNNTLTLRDETSHDVNPDHWDD